MPEPCIADTEPTPPASQPVLDTPFQNPERPPTPPQKEDPIYTPIREGNLEEIRRLLEVDSNYQLVVPLKADEVITPLFVACTLKNAEIITYLLNHPITREEINVGIPSHKFYTPLHLVASEGDIELVKLLLEAGADPTSKDISSKTPYDCAKNKETRLVMRSFAGKNLDKWDYNLAHIYIFLLHLYYFIDSSLNIEPLTDSDKKEHQKKKADKLKKKKQTQKQKKENDKKDKEQADIIAKLNLQEEEAKKISKDTKQAHDMKVKGLSDREKRALAAEQRLMASKGIFVTCGQCKKEIVGIPFERLEFKYCTTKCVVEHKKVLGR